MKKKIITLAFVCALVLALLTACGGGGASDSGGAGTESDGTSGAADGGSFDSSKEIVVVSREDGSGTRTAFIELTGVEEKKDDGSKTDLTMADAVIAKATDVMMTNVGNDPYAIGYISLGSLNDTVKAVQIDGVDATPENVKNGSYAIQRPFNIVTKGDAEGLAKDFIDFILSSDGQTVVADGYIKVDEAAAAYAGTKPEGKIVVAGSSSVTPIMEKLKEAYVAINTGAEIEIQQSDSSAGINGAIEGTCDIGMASRELKPEEASDLKPVQIAIDGIAVIINNGNTTANLTMDQVKSIYTGETTSWSGLS